MKGLVPAEAIEYHAIARGALSALRTASGDSW
jgi:hypothetical protein